MEKKPALIRPAALAQWLGMSRSKLYQLVREGDFPAPIKLGPRFTAWRISDVERWLAERVTDTSSTSGE